jgi:hypothetical protein
MVVNATCRGCQSFIKAISSVAPMMFAVGPGLDLSSDDLDARIRRHTAHGSSPLSRLPCLPPRRLGN